MKINNVVFSAQAQPTTTVPISTISQPIIGEDKNERYGSGTTSRTESRAGVERPYSKQQEYGTSETSQLYDVQQSQQQPKLQQPQQQQQQPQYQDISNIRSESRLSKYNTSSDKYSEEKRVEPRSDSSLGKYSSDAEKYTDEKRSESRLSKISADGDQSKYGGIEKQYSTAGESSIEKPIGGSNNPKTQEYADIPKYESPITQSYSEANKFEEQKLPATTTITSGEQYNNGGDRQTINYEEQYQNIGQNESLYDPNIAGYDNTQYTEQQYSASAYDPNVEYTQQNYDAQQYGTEYQDQQYAGQQEYSTEPVAYDTTNYQSAAIEQQQPSQTTRTAGYVEQEQGNGTLGYTDTGRAGMEQYQQQ